MNGSERPCGSCYVVEGPHRSDCYWYDPSYESGSKSHTLKVNTQFWDALSDGSKPFDLRRNDRAFKVGDTLRLCRFDPSFGLDGQERTAVISYMLLPEDCPGLQPGFCILGLAQPKLKRCAWLYNHKDRSTELGTQSLTQGDKDAGWSQEPLYRVIG